MKSWIGACLVFVGLAAPCVAETILKVDMGTTTNDGPDVKLVGSVFSTIDDGLASTTGDQNTSVNFVGFLGSTPDIAADVASFSISNVTVDGAPNVLGPVVVQPTKGGSIRLWDSTNLLLLAADIADGAIVGSLAGASTGSFANLSLGSIAGGSLAAVLKPNDFAISIAMTDVNHGLGMTVLNNQLQPFTAGATANIAADQVPDPSGTTLLGVAFAGLVAAARYRRGR